jgi:cytochrome C oxidase subunit II, periplasmic domain
LRHGIRFTPEHGEGLIHSLTAAAVGGGLFAGISCSCLLLPGCMFLSFAGVVAGQEARAVACRVVSSACPPCGGGGQSRADEGLGPSAGASDTISGMKTAHRLPTLLPLLAVTCLAAGCNLVAPDSSGLVAQQDNDFFLLVTGLMLLVVVPVIGLVLFFAWRYRAGHALATHAADVHPAPRLQIALWLVPLTIVLVLALITFRSTSTPDPVRPLAKNDAHHAAHAGVEPLDVQVVALDWKWLFIYPGEGIATVNEMAVPVGRPVHFRLTASSVMNSFHVPALGSTVRVLPGTESQLDAVINRPGVYVGRSGLYSGAGFAGMQFRLLSLDDKDYDAWVEKARSSGTGPLTRANYLKLAQPSVHEHVREYASVDPGLYERIRLRCVEEDRMCSDMIMAIDAQGGLGRLGVDGVVREAISQPTHRGEVTVFRSYVSEALCTPMMHATDMQAHSPLPLPKPAAPAVPAAPATPATPATP